MILSTIQNLFWIFQNMPTFTRQDRYLNILDAISLSLFFVVIGYNFLLFCYFILIKFRKIKKLYWFYFSIFFLLIAISRGFFVVYDYFMEYFGPHIMENPLLPLTIYRLAEFTGWLASAMLVGILSSLLFIKNDKKSRYLRYSPPIIVIGLALLWLILPPQYLIDMTYFVYSPGGYGVDPGVKIIPSPFLPNMAIGLFYLNYVILPIINFLLPLIFFYIAKKSVGLIRRSSLLNGFGFLTYYGGRALEPLLKALNASLLTQAILPPLIILLGLLLLALANFILNV
ncbi:MAG: hypothetical protein ACTSU2_02240 [Promethearchaeota archaeon]